MSFTEAKLERVLLNILSRVVLPEAVDQINERQLSTDRESVVVIATAT